MERSYRYYLAANPPGRIEMLVFMTATPELFKAYFLTVQQFVEEWTFADAAKPAAALPESSRLEGVYAGYKFIYVTILGAVQKKAVEDFYSFFPDGTVYWGLPRHGLVRLQHDASARHRSRLLRHVPGGG